jgi:kynurenine formamidase
LNFNLIMKAQLNTITIDFSQPIDISIPLTNNYENPIAWYQEPPVFEPVKMENWVGKVATGSSSTNFNNLFFNPHAHGTHTECLGHITHEFYSINSCLKRFFFKAKLISITPEAQGSDLVITKEQIASFGSLEGFEALIIRTLPNLTSKKSLNYSNTNPPYLEADAATYMRKEGVLHLLIDLPSVDKEHDEGKLAAHKAFWNVKDTKKLNDDARKDCTITEMIFVPTHIPDASYYLNLQIASFENDASPSKPVLYAFL